MSKNWHFKTTWCIWSSTFTSLYHFSLVSACCVIWDHFLQKLRETALVIWALMFNISIRVLVHTHTHPEKRKKHLIHTYHEWCTQCSVSWRANEVCHLAVHRAHDVHVHCAALETLCTGGVWVYLHCILYIVCDFMFCWRHPYQSSHAELKAKHQI